LFLTKTMTSRLSSFGSQFDPNSAALLPLH
jgi:hypothetical protein